MIQGNGNNMARVTIEDCLNAIEGHFNVAKIASRRAHKLEFGATSELEKMRDKNTVLALREIAAKKVDKSILDEPLDDLMKVDQPSASALELGEANKPTETNEPSLAAQVQPSDVGQMVADVEKYSDMNEQDKPDLPDQEKQEESTSPVIAQSHTEQEQDINQEEDPIATQLADEETDKPKTLEEDS